MTSDPVGDGVYNGDFSPGDKKENQIQNCVVQWRSPDEEVSQVGKLTVCDILHCTERKKRNGLFEWLLSLDKSDTK